MADSKLVRANDLDLCQDWQYAGYQDDDEQEDDSQEDTAPDPNTITEHRRLHPKVVLNVGGRRHEVMWTQLEKKPLTRLGRLARAKTHEDILELADGYSLANNEIYYDRQGELEGDRNWNFYL